MVFTVRGTPVGFAAISAGLIASMGGFLFGYDTGQISGLTQMKDFIYRFGTETTYNSSLDPDKCEGAIMCKAINSWINGLIVSFMSIGTMFGAMAGAYIADYLGRRRAMQVEVLIFCIGLIIQMASFWSWVQFAVGRLVSGLAIGALSCAVPVYQSETVPRQVRGTLVATYQWAITAGILLSDLFSMGTKCIGSCHWKDIYGTTEPVQVNQSSKAAQWRVVVGLGFVFSAILAVGIQFCPESPRWLAMKGRFDEAHEAVALVRGKTVADKDPIVEAEFLEICEAAREEQENDVTWLDVFKPANKTLYRTILGMVLQMGQQLTGANYFFYYGTQIMTPVGVTDPFVTSVIFGAVNFVCTIFGLWALEAIGRRLPLIFGGLWCSAWLLIFASAGVGRNLPAQPGGDKKLGDPHLSPATGKLMICAGCFFILGYASTWAPGIWLFTGEVFDSRTRARQAALATLSNWIWNFLLAFFTTPITNRIGFAYGYVFAFMNAVNALVAYFAVYETKDLNLEQVNAMYCDPNCHAWTSRKWVPEGMSSRGDIQAEVTRAPKGGYVHDEDEASTPGQLWHNSTSSQDEEMKAAEKEAEVGPNTQVHTSSA